MPLVKSVHAINTTVSMLHGVTPMEVVIGRAVNEKSVLLASKNSRERFDSMESDLDDLSTEDKTG